ncbi:threonylcarbamoyl-AMP synthase, partial [Candidatus Dojkabacteria bacterium]|nr:threonylcarbamoyl-AMP synthase [Candidatus Dojkabacteria bacterium]
MKTLRLEKGKSYKRIIQEAINTLEVSGMIVYPTETCYGIGVDATNQVAVDKLMKYKSRREGKPLSVAVSDREMASKYAEINDLADNLYKNYLPGPVTVISKGLGKLAKGVESEFGTLGIRIPDYPLILDIVSKLGRPVTSTSANISYKNRPYSIEALLKDTPEKQLDLIDLIIDAGELPHNEPSTVVDTTLNNLNVMRAGSLKFNQNLTEDKIIFAANTKSVQETENFGAMVMLKFIDTPLKQPFVLALKGELGAGKTQFVKGLAKSLKIADQISSPTYTLIDEYKYNFGHRKGCLAHMDTWRVDGAEELLRTGYSGYLQPGNVLAIEWADKFLKKKKNQTKDEKTKKREHKIKKNINKKKH